MITNIKTYHKYDFNIIDSSKVKTKSNSKIYKTISLFSGIGGMDLGFLGEFNFLDNHFEKNPFDIVFANDIFKQAADVYETNLNHQVKKQDIAELNLDTDLPSEEIDVILGGFPCQTFSYSGKRRGLSDPRGQLYKQMIRVTKHYMPKIFVAENVDGIRNSRKNNLGKNVDSSALDTILNDFEQIGYNVQYHVLNAADYGVPQRRRRVIIVGIRKDLGDNSDVYYPATTNDETGLLTNNRWLTAEDGIDDLWGKLNSTEVHNHTIKDYSKAKFYKGKKMQGNNRIDRLRPAPTIRAEHHGNIEGHYKTYLNDETDMDGWRRLSIRECARLQSFPDTFIFPVSVSSAYKGIGNAVPPVMAWHIAKGIQYTLENMES